MYNIAKVAKGEILLFFNEVFDALCKVRKYLLSKSLLSEAIARRRLRAICEEWCRAPR